MVERGVEVGVVANGGWKMHLGRGLNVISSSIQPYLDVYNVSNGLNVISIHPTVSFIRALVWCLGIDLRHQTGLLQGRVTDGRAIPDLGGFRLLMIL